MEEPGFQFLDILSTERGSIFRLQPSALRFRGDTLCTHRFIAVAFDFLAPAAFTSPPDPAPLNLEGLSVGEGLFADADTFLLLGSGGGRFGSHGG
jgi:hypothetical protein